MLERRILFPHVIEMNYQAGQRLGCNVYLVFDRNEWILIDIGYEETVDEIVELVRQMDFNLSACKMLIATHADAVVACSALRRSYRDRLRGPVMDGRPTGWAAANARIVTGDDW